MQNINKDSVEESTTSIYINLLFPFQERCAWLCWNSWYFNNTIIWFTP